jgi:Zn-dependent protease with chaperone function
MIKCLRAALVGVYTFLTVFAFLLALRLSGVFISEMAGWMIIAIWCLFCFSSFYLGTRHFLFLHDRADEAPRARPRLPILQEEEKILPCLQEVLRNASCNQSFQLRIEDAKEWNVFATGPHTIVVTQTILTESTEEELKGMLAHELGHLMSKDPAIDTAFLMAGLLPRSIGWLGWCGRQLLSMLFFPPVLTGTATGYRRIGRFNLLRGLLGILVAGYIFYRFKLLQSIVPAVASVILFYSLEKLFKFFYRLVSLLADFRQDAYACRLGFGPGLRQALLKQSIRHEPQKRPQRRPLQRPYAIGPQQSAIDPQQMIYRRIRRLEKLESLRA